MKTRISQRFFARFTAVALMLMLGFAAALAAGTPAKADESAANYSFYKLSSSLAAFFSNAQSPDENATPIDAEVWTSVLDEPGNAGSMLGYVDPDFSFSMEFLNSQISGSSSAVGYSTLLQSTQGVDDGARATSTPGMLDYAHFGAALNGLGLDSMGTGLSLGFMESVSGGVIMLLFSFSSLVDLLFLGLIETLKLLNPFKLFFEGVRAINPGLAEGMTGGQAPPGFLGGLSSWIGDWYQVLNNLAWAVLVPLFIGVVLLGLVLSKKMNRGSAIKKLFIRMLFIGVGLPLVGSMYTGVLNQMGDASKTGGVSATHVVLNTYVDFEAWAFKNRLMVPENAIIEWNASAGKPTTAAVSNVRNTALEINKSTNPNWSGVDSSLKVNQDQSWTNAAMAASDQSAGTFQSNVDILWMLARYMDGTKIDAASYETAVKGDISTAYPYLEGPAGKKRVSDWFAQFGDPKKSLPGIEDPAVVAGNPVLTVAANRGLVATPQGATGGTKQFTSPSQWGCEAWVSNDRGEPLNCNMSTLAVYNYLNTSFGSDSMTMYSSNKATSGATREMHNSVTQVGTGLTGLMYWLNSAVLLASFVVIGVGYAFSMLFSNIKRGIQLMTAIPFATIGAIPGIAKVLVYATAMILEVIMTLFLYKFIQVFLISIPQIVEMPFAAAVNANPTSDGALAVSTAGTLPLIMTTLSIIALVVFTILALRVRKTVIKAINEVVTKLVDKFLETGTTPPGGKGALAPALAGGVAQGAGMAAANRAMGGGGAGSPGKVAGTSGEGPAGISTGGISPNGGPGPDSGTPAGQLTVGGGADMDVSGEIGEAGPDGSGGRPGGGGSGGTPPGSSPAEGPAAGLRADSQDRALASTVQAQGGLSSPGSSGSGDVTDTMAGSVDKTRSQYAAKDKAAADGAVSGGKAVAKGAEAAGRGMAGDVTGAVSAGTAAVGHAQSTQSSARQAKSLQKDIDSPAAAGRSISSGAQPADRQQGVPRALPQQKPVASAQTKSSSPQKPGVVQGTRPGPAQGYKGTGNATGTPAPKQAPAARPAAPAPKQAPVPKPPAPAKNTGPRMAPSPRSAPATPRPRPVQGSPARRPDRKDGDA
ncbi:hypothetical protein [Arthrobacter koreensis]|uniref:hypothetical protein n=1 Tax=Arthrobacter koreensis TaxID=199136 RepID=UPI00381649F9